MPIDLQDDTNQAVDVAPLSWRFARDDAPDSTSNVTYLMRGWDATQSAGAGGWVTWTSSGTPNLTPSVTTPAAGGPITRAHVLVERTG